MYELRKCPYSGELFKPKRNNQKYASKQNRLAFHNKRYRQNRMPQEYINRKLYINHSIISEIIGDNNEIEVNNDYIKALGYNFIYVTHLYSHNNQTYMGLYNFYFIRLNKSTTKFFKNESNRTQ